MSRRSAPFSLPSCHTPGGAPRNRVRVTICHLHPPAASANPIRPSESLNSRPTPKVYEMVCEVNEGLEQQRQQEIKDYLEEDKRVTVQEQITETMVVCINATKVPTRVNENANDPANKSYECQYRDSKVATVSAVQKQNDAAEPAPTEAPAGAAEDNDDDQVVHQSELTAACLMLLIVVQEGAWLAPTERSAPTTRSSVWMVKTRRTSRRFYGEQAKSSDEPLQFLLNGLRESRRYRRTSTLLRCGGFYPKQKLG